MREFYLKDYINLLINKKKMIVFGTLVCMLCAALITLILPNIYQAKALVYVFPAETKTEFAPQEVSLEIREGIAQLEKNYNFRGGVEEVIFYINTFSELAESPQIFKQVIDRLGLRDVTIEDLDKMLKARLLEVQGSLTQRSFAPIIRLIVEAKNRKLAQDLANAWAEVLTEKINKIFNRFEADYNAILEELAISKSNLLEAEKSLADFKKTAGMDVLEMESKASQLDFLTYNSELNKVLVSMQTKGMPEQEINALKEKEKYLLELMEKSKKDISRLQAEIYEKQYQLTQLQREFEINSSSYELLQQKKEQFKISNVERPARAAILANAAEPQKHIRPMRALTVTIAGALGLMMMCFLIFLKR